jgi:hypothetical protein
VLSLIDILPFLCALVLLGVGALAVLLVLFRIAGWRLNAERVSGPGPAPGEPPPAARPPAV